MEGTAHRGVVKNGASKLPVRECAATAACPLAGGAGERALWSRCARNERARSRLRATHPAPDRPAAYDGKRIHKETLSPFDATEYRGKEIAGQHPPAPDSRGGDLHSAATTARPDPKGALGG
jgi:hypothetical protein